MRARNEMVWMAAKVGAVFGVLAFLAFGLLQGIYVGGMGTLTALSLLTGRSLDPTLSVKIMAIVGMGLGVALFAAISGGLGALLGTVIGYVLEPRGIRVLVEKKAKAGVAAEGQSPADPDAAALAGRKSSEILKSAEALKEMAE